MLVLTRKLREGIVVSEGPVNDPNDERIVLRFRIIEVRGDRVKIGIEAPEKYAIVREELLFKSDE